LTDAEFRAALQSAGFDQIEIRATHRVHERASAAIIRARKPGPSACCAPAVLATCCDPAARTDCCGPTSAGGAPATCGCIG
jgi:hypothetical protein